MNCCFLLQIREFVVTQINFRSIMANIRFALYLSVRCSVKFIFMGIDLNDEALNLFRTVQISRVKIFWCASV